MRLTVTMFQSVDGVTQAPGAPDEDRSGGFEHGGWTVPYGDDDFGRSMADWFTEASAFLLGRKTYEIFAAHWPRVTDDGDPIASRLNRLPKYVASRTLDRAGWDNTTIIKGNVQEEVAKLKRQPGGELQVHGSGDLIQTLTAHDLVDEYRLLVFPVVLGSGKRLFPEGTTPNALRLIGTKTTSKGVAIHTYQPAGKPTYGSYALDDR
jgi:dihydrofolate reductase